MPQIGQVPGPSCTISGCMGQVWRVPGGGGGRGSAWSGGRERCGSAKNFVRTPALQQGESVPSWVEGCGVVCGGEGRQDTGVVGRSAGMGWDGASAGRRE